ncbi:MAG: PIN domain-containing protein [Treponema sp.]|nr:PIN domain-containing protein [Treponema sp.]
MKALIDINILLDVILRRESHFSESKRIIDCCITFVDGYIALHSFSTLFYVLHEKEHKDTEYCRNTFNNLLYVFDVAGLTKPQLIQAVNDGNFSDLEDSMQHGSALACDVDYIITRDRNDFKDSVVPALTPAEFLRLVHEEA